MSGVAPGDMVPGKWSATENVRWKVSVPGQGWSSPIGATVFLTAGISSKPFKSDHPDSATSTSPSSSARTVGEEGMRRVRARDNESPKSPTTSAT